MSRHLVRSTTALMLSVLMPPLSMSAEPPPGWSAAQHEVWRTVVAWNDAFARNDTEAFFRFFDPQITVIAPGVPYRVIGIRDDREEFEFSLKRGVSRVGYFQELDPHVAVHGDAAVVTYYSRGFYGAESGTTRYYKETDVLIRRDDSWKIVHIHISNPTQ